jgi:hypothetical protein
MFRRIAALEREIDVLKRQRVLVHNELRQLDERVDTVFSWPWKRVWWFLQGYRWYTVGRWYK